MIKKKTNKISQKMSQSERKLDYIPISLKGDHDVLEAYWKRKEKVCSNMRQSHFQNDCIGFRTAKTIRIGL